MKTELLTLTENGLYCPKGDFYIDSKGSVGRTLVTHAHADHARRGAKEYITSKSGLGLLRARLGQRIQARGIPYGEKFLLGAVTVSFHPAGHILGSAQVRLESKGVVWVVSGDYKRAPDPTAEPFELVPCDVFVTEATFGTPGFCWAKTDLGSEIYAWWQENQAQGYNSLLFAYSLGKTQRVLGELARFPPGPLYCAPPAMPLVQCYRNEGVELAPAACLSTASSLRGALVLAPKSILSSSFASLLGNYRTAFASGWTAQGSYGYDRGFVMSDHADWNDLLQTVRETGAKRVYVQHRGTGALVRALRKLGLEAFSEEELAKPGMPFQQMALPF